tara:strand:+ start:150 stop:1094 length:945 start_codon:yes stop_codon:yes gene_type:complete
MIIKKPKFWDYKNPNYLSKILSVLTFPVILNNFFIKIRKKQKTKNIKTICVGNIYLGGTGKTPLTLKIDTILKNLNLKTATIRKYYKDQIDEQKILNEKTKLYCLKKRTDAIQLAIQDKIDVAIFDDGLQDSKMDYDLKFVCFNSLKWVGNGKLIPAGPLRENISSLSKYDAVFLNGKNENINDLKNIIEKYNSNILTFETNYQIINPETINKFDRYTIFCGIGNPDSFKETLLINKIQIYKEFIFPDHYDYTNNDISMIKSYAKKFNTKILTTEKDYIKLKPLLSSGIDVIKVELNITQPEKLIDLIKLKLKL